MSKSTPDDLVVAFRSLERRRREALDAVEGAPVTSQLADLDRHIAAAATLLGTTDSPSAVADAIAVWPGDEWEESLLDELRGHATGAGTALRRVVDATPAERDE